MMMRRAKWKCGRDNDGHVLRQLRRRFASYGLHRENIRARGQVRAVLLGGADRQHGERSGRRRM